MYNLVPYNNAKLFNNVDTEISSSYGYNKTNNIITFENKYPVKTILKALNKNSELIWTPSPVYASFDISPPDITGIISIPYFVAKAKSLVSWTCR